MKDVNMYIHMYIYKIYIVYLYQIFLNNLPRKISFLPVMLRHTQFHPSMTPLSLY